jgi:hypothetical protein
MEGGASRYQCIAKQRRQINDAHYQEEKDKKSSSPPAGAQRSKAARTEDDRGESFLIKLTRFVRQSR